MVAPASLASPFRPQPLHPRGRLKRLPMPCPSWIAAQRPLPSPASPMISSAGAAIASIRHAVEDVLSRPRRGRGHQPDRQGPALSRRASSIPATPNSSPNSRPMAAAAAAGDDAGRRPPARGAGHHPSRAARAPSRSSHARPDRRGRPHRRCRAEARLRHCRAAHGRLRASIRMRARTARLGRRRSRSWPLPPRTCASRHRLREARSGDTIFHEARARPSMRGRACITIRGSSR